MLVVIGIAIGLVAGAGLAFLSLYALTGSRLAAARRTRQLLVSEAKRDARQAASGRVESRSRVAFRGAPADLRDDGQRGEGAPPRALRRAGSARAGAPRPSGRGGGAW